MAKTKEEAVQKDFVAVELTSPIKVNGVDLAALRMREPTVNDQLVHEQLDGTEGEKEVATFANLCQVTPADIRTLTVRDYRKLQKAYSRFLV